jgi:uncharacterized coiled-coil DUF342 family protein
MIDWTKMCQDYGLIGVMMAAFITFLGFILKWVLAQFKVELEANRVERCQYLDTLHAIRTEIQDHNARSKEFCAGVSAEHKETSNILREITATLGRINGYKKE